MARLWLHTDIPAQTRCVIESLIAELLQHRYPHVDSHTSLIVVVPLASIFLKLWDGIEGSNRISGYCYHLR